MIGHGGLLRAFSFARRMSRADLGFAVQFNAETPWHFAQLRYPRVG